ncbi:MAG: phage protein NinX family protein [Kluyvera cryocrescens]|nr:phage protein NinX family protein [Kluyvera cryocrescens]
MDYSKMSDHEINKMVAISLGKDVMPDDCQDFGISGFSEVMLRNGDIKDYCNEASDAWPIIEKYRISFLDQLTEWCVDAKGVSPVFEANPLRGAMIVFLLMQEPANVQGNPA